MLVGVRSNPLLVLAVLCLANSISAPVGAEEDVSAQQRALATAVQQNNVDTVHNLLAKGVKAPPVSLVQAVNRSGLEMIQALVDGGTDVNAALDLVGIEATPLGSAVLKNRADVVSLLLDAGAKVDALHMARTPLELARENNFKDIVSILAARTSGGGKLSGFEALLAAIANGEHAEIRSILASGQNPDETDSNGDAPIHYAARIKDGEAVRMLLAAGADPDQRDSGGAHASEMAVGFDSVFGPLLEASPELQDNRRAPPAQADKVYTAGAVVGGPCQHSGRIPQDAGCGATGTELFSGTKIFTSGWSGAVGPPLCEPVKLPPLPGQYTVMVVETTSKWKGDRCYENIGQVYFSRENADNTSSYSFIVAKSNECKAGEHRMSETEDYGPVVQEGFAGEVQAAFVDALRSYGVEAGPEHVTIDDTGADNPLFSFGIRISNDHCVLPHMRAISRECIREGSQESAVHMLTGSIQRTGSRTRATVRVFKVETGQIDSTGKGDADGTDAQAIEDAVEKALDAMDYKITCTKGVNR